MKFTGNLTDVKTRKDAMGDTYTEIKIKFYPRMANMKVNEHLRKASLWLTGRLAEDTPIEIEIKEE